MTTPMSMEWPTADELDTGNYRENSGYRMDVYLIPAAESASGIPALVAVGRFGPGMPGPAWNNRWEHVMVYGPRVVGASVLRALQDREADLLARAACYRGATWDGGNMVGQWGCECDDLYRGHACSVFAQSIADGSDYGFAHYWDARDWYGANGETWEDLCAAAGVDVERGLDPAEAAIAAREIEAAIQAEQEEPVTGTAAYAEECAMWWREDHA